MTIAEILVVKLGTRLAKFLLKTYLREPGEAVGSELVDIAKGKIESYFDQRAAIRQFEGIGESVAVQFLPFFEIETLSHEINSEAVIDQLAKTLDGNISGEFFLARDLDSAKLLAELHRIRPLPRGQFSEAEVALYERSLAEAIRYLIEIASDLPNFNSAYMAESLRRLSLIGANVEDTVKMVLRIERLVSRQGGDPQSQQYETDYRLAVARNLGYLELFGADLAPESRRRSLSLAYIPLNLQSGRSLGGKASLLVVDSVLRSIKPGSGRLLIRGEAGSGKTTLFRWIAIEAATNTSWNEAQGRMSKVSPISQPRQLYPLLNSWERKVPFFIRLRECKDGRLPSPDDFPDSIAREIGRPPAAWVSSILREGRGLLLLDGVDEVPRLDRKALEKDLDAIISAYPENYFIVSTRPEAVPDDWLIHLGFRELWVSPMSEATRAQFIDKWHNSVAFELARLGRSEENFSQSSMELKRKLRDNPSLNRLSMNPLLCAVICAVHYEKKAELPKNLPDLCDSLCRLLLDRDPARGVPIFPPSYSLLSYSQKRAIVRELAYTMILNHESSLTYKRAHEKIAEALRLFPNMSTDDAEDICAGLVERSGMLREVKPGYLDFIHNTFKEYLAGDRMADSGDAGLLAQQALSPNWQGVVLFAMATSRLEFASDVIWRLLDVENFPINLSGVRDPRRTRLLQAMRCTAVALFVAPELEHPLIEAAREVQPPRNIAEAEAFASLGGKVIEFLRRRDGFESSDAAACVRALRLIATPEAKHALEGYLMDRRVEVISELAQIFNPLAIKFYREELLAGEQLSSSITSQISDLSELDHLPLEKLDRVQTIHLKNSAIEDLKPLRSLKNLRTLTLDNSFVRDLAPIAALRSLEELSISGTCITDISVLSQLPTLRWLDISGTQVSSIASLENLLSLEHLDLADTRVRDISPLSNLKKLRYVNLRSTDVVSLQPLAGRHDVELVGPS